MNTNNIRLYAEIIQDTLSRNTPISDDQFNYFLKINQLDILEKNAVLSYKPKMNTALSYNGSWKILAEIKNNLDLKGLEKSLIENNIIEKTEEIKNPYYQPDITKYGPGLGAEIHKKDIKLEIRFYHGGKK